MGVAERRRGRTREGGRDNDSSVEHTKTAESIRGDEKATHTSGKYTHEAYDQQH